MNPTTPPPLPEPDFVAEANRVCRAADELPLRLAGGLAIAINGEPLLSREQRAIDVVTSRGTGAEGPTPGSRMRRSSGA